MSAALPLAAVIAVLVVAAAWSAWDWLVALHRQREAARRAAARNITHVGTRRRP